MWCKIIKNSIIELITKIPIYNFFKKISYSSKSINIDKVRCQRNLEFSNFLGFGGKHIKYFPPYQIFTQYLKQPTQARKDFALLLYNTFLEKNGWKIPKNKGGYYLGSLYSEIENIFKKKGIVINSKNLLANRVLIEQGIDIRIDHYFNTFDSIIRNGYNPTLQPIIAEKKDGLYYLKNGHHRTAMLLALGYKKILLMKQNIFEGVFSRLFR